MDERRRNVARRRRRAVEAWKGGDCRRGQRARLERVYERERRAFVSARPRSIELWDRAKSSMPNGVPMSWLRFFMTFPDLRSRGGWSRFRDVDGIEYADFNIADISMFCGYAPQPVVDVVAERVRSGSQFMLANEDAVWVAEELARRYGLPKWQFTLSASQANTEAVRLARAATGRDKVLFFDGKYHGHFDDALVELRDGEVYAEEPGLPRVHARSGQDRAVQRCRRTRGVRFRLRCRRCPHRAGDDQPVGLVLPTRASTTRSRAVTREYRDWC